MSERAPNDVITNMARVNGGPTEPHKAAQSATYVITTEPKLKKGQSYPDPIMLKASGAPLDWGRCRALSRGQYKDGNCQMKRLGKERGKFEFFPIPS